MVNTILLILTLPCFSLPITMSTINTSPLSLPQEWQALMMALSPVEVHRLVRQVLGLAGTPPGMANLHAHSSSLINVIYEK